MGNAKDKFSCEVFFDLNNDPKFLNIKLEIFRDIFNPTILNIKTAQKAREDLKNGGAIIIFPSGGVSVARNLKSEAIDDDWKLFPAKLIQQTKADILPIFFDGKNGLLFHLFASKLKNQTLKYSSYIHETKKKIGKEVIIYSGDIINYKDISHFKSRTELTEYLKETTYNLKNNN